jgi:hypothetical protein
MDEKELELTGKEGREALAAGINDMISRDFAGLINLLYRFDIDEKKLREHLRLNGNKDAGLIIADLLIERQIKKQKSRDEYKNTQNETDEDEKW